MLMNNIKRFFTIFALVAFGASITIDNTLAQTANAPERIGEHGDWLVYHYGSGVDEICYILSEPKRKHPGGLNRGRVFFSVTHREDGTRNEVSLRAGYKFSSKSKPFAKISGREFSFYTGVQEGDERAHWAWMHSPEDETAFIEAMKKGSEMVIKGTSSRGTLTTDTYSLIGVTKALEAIDKKCQ